MIADLLGFKRVPMPALASDHRSCGPPTRGEREARRRMTACTAWRDAPVGALVYGSSDYRVSYAYAGGIELSRHRAEVIIGRG